MLPHPAQGTRCRLQDPHKGCPPAVRAHTARLWPQRAQRDAAHLPRAVLAARRAGGGQVAGLFAAAQRAGGQRRAVAAPASRAAVLPADGQGGPAAGGAPVVVGRVAAKAFAADRLAGRGAAGHLGGLLAAAAGLEPGLAVAAPAAARRAEPVAQRHRPAA